LISLVPIHRNQDMHWLT